MTVEKIKEYHLALLDAKDSPGSVAAIQVELAAQAAYIGEELKNLRAQKPGFFLSRKQVEGKPPSNDAIEMMWNEHTKSREVELKSDLEILDRFLTAAKACLVSLSIESRVQE